ncbi:polymer-forming cytoskeletal protein [Pseudodesulfovibrio sp. zrk46]|uniref:bactofilin family protein n=1 Tax=Pseudodesulfovibrio sp. zrk46 TaxID=2725288 RepID=UPI0014494C94|nr:polymer-forming cytoskeletal protein [Pseudodesulfovibrio sp. zrk46]QJB56272.1 polymer-forming cytoskeletal protein [Pseudodesulfovibrio sp. zrk46]
MARDEINAFLGAGTNYQGKLHFQGAVRIDGNFQGEVVSDGTLVVGQEAVVEGQVRVGQLVLSGNIQGEVEAKNKVVLHKTANLQGNIRTPSLVVEEGAVLEGQLVMGSLDATASATPEEDSK